jgi:SPX domain protein involved in polyphosphate accumulation/uncharacterized membrane protein YidH (DUF202 family)
MKFGKYLLDKERPEWSGKYLDYAALKDLIKNASREFETAGFAAPSVHSPRAASLTVLRGENARDSAEEQFFQTLEDEVDKIGSFTSEQVNGLRNRLYDLQQRIVDNRSEILGKTREGARAAIQDELLREAKDIGDEFLQLEKYVNLNYMGFHKILKKHDKQLPHSPCRKFYISHLHNQPWVQGSYADLLVTLGQVYSEIRGDESALSSSGDLSRQVSAAPHIMGSSPLQQQSSAIAGSNSDGHGMQTLKSRTKYWVDVRHVSKVKHMILPHLPVYQFEENEYTGDSQLVNSVYLDNANLEVYHSRLKDDGRGMVVKLSWYGSQEPINVHVQCKTIVELGNDEGDAIQDPNGMELEFIIPSSMVLPFIEAELDSRDAVDFWRSNNMYQDEESAKISLFEEVKTLVDSKQLKPVLRCQYMRTYFQIPFDKTVQVKMDTNIIMMKENPDDGPMKPGCISLGRWFRDPSLPLHRTEVTHFPHAVLDLKLSLTGEQETPAWVQELVSCGDLEEMNNFSKQLHGMTALFPDLVQAVPYWVDKDSVKASMLISAPEKPTDIHANARDVSVSTAKPRSVWMNDSEVARGPPSVASGRTGRMSGRKLYTTPRFIEWWFSKPPMKAKNRPNIPGHVEQRLEPKTLFANERTFLSWLNMALTMGSIATALIGMSSGENENSTTLIALILLPAAVVMCAYSVFVYYWRSDAIMQHREVYYDDRRGPFALTFMVVVSLALILGLGVVDLFDQLHQEHQAPDMNNSALVP